MVICWIWENLFVEEVLEWLDVMDVDLLIVYDLFELEIEDEEVVVVFFENLVGIEDNFGDSFFLLDEECEFLSESEVDCCEYVRE